jgi:hypothetical protein
MSARFETSSCLMGCIDLMSRIIEFDLHESQVLLFCHLSAIFTLPKHASTSNSAMTYTATTAAAMCTKPASKSSASGLVGVPCLPTFTTCDMQATRQDRVLADRANQLNGACVVCASGWHQPACGWRLPPSSRCWHPIAPLHPLCASHWHAPRQPTRPASGSTYWRRFRVDHPFAHATVNQLSMQAPSCKLAAHPRSSP